MKVPSAVVLMNKFIEAVVKLDDSGKLKLTVGSSLSTYLYEINGPDKEDGHYIYCDNIYCTVEYRHFTKDIRDVFTLTEENLADCAQELYITLIGA